jgi:hypothetical protein
MLLTTVDTVKEIQDIATCIEVSIASVKEKVGAWPTMTNTGTDTVRRFNVRVAIGKGLTSEDTE